jgi:hypothetical protein
LARLAHWFALDDTRPLFAFAGIGGYGPAITPTPSSWLNLVERFFADLTGDVIRAGSFASVNELVRD